MKTSEAISLGIALLLTAYLVLSWRLRARRHPPENHWSGRGIDVTLIAGRVQSIRRTFGSALTPRQNLSFHHELVASARRVIGQLSYFRRRNIGQFPKIDFDDQ